MHVLVVAPEGTYVELQRLVLLCRGSGDVQSKRYDVIHNSHLQLTSLDVRKNIQALCYLLYSNVLLH
jgi:hypothetical protein